MNLVALDSLVKLKTGSELMFSIQQYNSIKITV